jgi:hypothetical protein
VTKNKISFFCTQVISVHNYIISNIITFAMTEIVANKENIPIENCSAKCKHLQENDTGKNICIPCAMTIEDWQLLETLDEQSVKEINAHGLLAFLGFTVIEGELFHIDDFEDVDMDENEEMLEET